MGDATLRDLRIASGFVLERVAAGELVTITRDGKPVARLERAARGRLTADVLVERFRLLPTTDPDRFRSDVDAAVDERL